MNRIGKFIFFALIVSGISLAASAQRVRMRPIVPIPGPVYVRPNGRPYNNLQPHQKPIEQIEEEFISTQLALGVDQTNRFVATFRKYRREQVEVRTLRRLNNSSDQPNGADQLNKDMAYQQQLVDIRNHYTQAFLKIMPPEKVSVIFKSEQYFNDEILRQIRERKNAANTPPPPSN